MSIKTLYVEDDSANKAVMTEMLAAIGQKNLTVASSGKEALEIIENPKSEFDVIIIDLGLPDMTGIELAKKIRMGNSKSKEIPMVAISGNNIPDAKDKSISAGINGFLKKPIDKELLRIVLERLLS